MSFTLYVDGGARGNPGPAAAGVVLTQGSKTLLAAGYLLDELTNNQAEYSALVAGLQAARRGGARDVAIYCDSELVVKQVTGQYRVASAGLKLLYEDVRQLLGEFHSWKIKHVRREQNARADQLLNQALDADEDVIEVDVLELAARLTPKEAAEGADRKSGPRPAAFRAVVTGAALDNMCPARCQEGDVYDFRDTVPDNLCLEGAYGLLNAILGSGEQRSAAATKVMCPRQGCQACFELRGSRE